MKGFTSKIFGTGAAAQALRITESPVPLHFSLSSFRWHQDIRPSMKIIAVHDYLGCSAAWEQTFNAAMADLPLTNHSPRDPVEIYCVDLRGHNHSEASLADLRPDAYALACAADVVRVQQEIVGGSEASLVGIGLGAMVSAAAMLHAPNAFGSAVLFVNSLSDLYRLDPTRSPLRDVLSANTDAKSFRSLSSALGESTLSDVDRALVLAMADELPSKTRLRVHKQLLDVKEPITVGDLGTSVCEAPVTVYIPGGVKPTIEEASTFARHFPHGSLQQLSASSMLTMCDPARSKLVLQALNVLEELQTE